MIDKRLSKTQLWLIEHPASVPPPTTAADWRKHEVLLAKYREAMAAKRAALAQSQQS